MIATTAIGYLWLFLSAVTAGGGFALGTKLMGKLVK